MRTFGQFILRTRFALVALIAVISVILGRGLPRLETKEDETTWFSASNPVLIDYKEFKGLFSATNYTVVAWSVEDPFGPEEHRFTKTFTSELERLPHVEQVLSLVNADHIRGTADGIDIVPMMPEPTKSPDERSALMRRIADNPLVTRHLLSDDHRTMAVVLDAQTRGKEEQGTFITALQELTARHQQSSGRAFHVGGEIITNWEVEAMMQADMKRFFPLSLLLTALATLALFRRFSSVIWPVVSVSLGLGWTLGLKGLLGVPLTPVSSALFALITTTGVATAVHLMSHYRLESAQTPDRAAAIVATFERAGKPCLFTAVTTMVGFGSLATSSILAVQNLGLFAAFGIVSVFFISLVIVPTGLLLVPAPTISNEQPSSLDRTLAAIGRYNVRHPKAVILVFLAATIISAAGIPLIHVEGSMLRHFKESTTIRKDAEFLDQHLAGVSSLEVLVRGAPGFAKEPETLRKLDALQRHAEENAKVISTSSLSDYVKLINRALRGDDASQYVIPQTRQEVAQELLLFEMSDGNGVEDVVNPEYDIARVSIRTRQMNERERNALIADVQSHVQSSLGAKVTTTGFDILTSTVSRAISSTMIYSLLLAFAVILVLMMVLFGIKGGLVSIIPNIFPIVAVIGLLGWGDFGLNAATSIIASVAIGIVVDDTIHYFTHFRHNLGLTDDPVVAMQRSLLDVGKAMTFTTIILALGFGIFLSSGLAILSNFGLLASLAVIMALAADLFLGPVLLILIRVFRDKPQDNRTTFWPKS
ncbi:MAG: hypothetical protein A2289_22730 [Deltaproteobacteria bacterium RIFOXYA12_FULL_58_15]|nr:MAG: hypothetical protein A2289_22730 [Deltaproteobacteria bacterium RIFOXYA12_FULL_58_15]OGR12768.1 MAG: hypothetical protein A2341_21785 [Deltaproteobacteria bacterium RIFOXYB12_FULL_58_9]